MSYADICDAVKKVKKKYNEDDPVRLCKDMGIVVLYKSFGTAPNAIKGFYFECKRIKTITVNSDLPAIIQRIIIAHELGHAMLHRTEGMSAFHDVAMFDESSMMEKEANLFAAEYLMDDKDVLHALNRDTTFFSAASLLCVPAELLDFKFRVMKWKGYKMVEPPISSSSNFLKDMEVPANADYYD